MMQYLDLLSEVYNLGEQRLERNGATRSLFGRQMVFRKVGDHFPIVTTKKVNFKAIVAELLGFIRGADSAAVFRELGTKIWDENANKVEPWKSGRYRKGTDDLGRIYGVQWRQCRYVKIGFGTPFMNYEKGEMDPNIQGVEVDHFDQLAYVIDLLSSGNDKRRAIINSWVPGEIFSNQMALAPCHMMCQFSVRSSRPGKRDLLDMVMYQRSADLPLGVPFNISSYALLMHIVGRICNLKPNTFTHVLGDAHIYENQVVVVAEQLNRPVHPLPQLAINPFLKTLSDFERATVEDFALIGYSHEPKLDYPFSG